MTAYAEDLELDEMFKEQLEVSGANELTDALPDEVREQLEDAGITPANGSEWSFSDLFSAISEAMVNSKNSVSATFGVLFSLILLSAMLERIAEGSKSAASRKAVNAVISAGVCIAAATPIAEYIADASDSAKLCCDFDAIFIPVWSVITAAAGKPAAAAQYSAVMLTVLESTSIFISQLAVPVLRIILAVALTSSLLPSLKLGGALKLFEKYLKWTLGFLAMLVAAIMGLGVATAGSMDEITTKTAKFILSSTVPIVGGAMGDALSSVTGCVSLLRTSVGGFGMIGMTFILLPPLIKGFMWVFCMNICSVVAEMLGIRCACEITDAVGSVLSVMIAILFFVGVLTIFTLAVMLGRG